MNKTISIIWGTEDIQSVRPDLNDDQAWEVLQEAKINHDANIGINWDVLLCIAEELFPEPEEIDDEEL